MCPKLRNIWIFCDILVIRLADYLLTDTLQTLAVNSVSDILTKITTLAELTNPKLHNTEVVTTHEDDLLRTASTTGVGASRTNSSNFNMMELDFGEKPKDPKKPLFRLVNF